MVRHYDYAKGSKTVLKNIRQILETEGYFINEYAPEDRFLRTDFKQFNWGKNDTNCSVVHITDRITISGMGNLMFQFLEWENQMK